MSMPKRALAAALVLAGAAGAAASPAAGEAQVQGPDLGRPASLEEIAAWDTTIAPDGGNLPPGRGTAAAGKAIYEAHCASCHGNKGIGRTAEELAGGIGSLTTDTPAKTVGSYWPYATTLYDYVFRAMPMAAPRSFTPDQVYAVSAYLLFLSGLIGADDEMSAKTLPAVEMPNRGGFVPIHEEPPT
ncbi:MAG: cytochrome c [Alphaproteobacteria bacterium]